jgi:hypothetical protein
MVEIRAGAADSAVKLNLDRFGAHPIPAMPESADPVTPAFANAVPASDALIVARTLPWRPNTADIR